MSLLLNLKKGLVFSYFLPLTSKAADLSNQAGAMSRGELLRVVVGLLVVVLVIIILSWLLRRLNGVKFANAKGLKIITCINLGTREKIMLIKAADRFLLLGVTSGSINTLHDFGEVLPPDFSFEAKTSFSEFLKTALRKT